MKIYDDDIPEEVKELLKLEKKYNDSYEFFEEWIMKLRNNIYTCPEKGVSFKKLSKINSRNHKKLVDAWEKANKHFKDEKIKEWFVKELLKLSSCIKLIRNLEDVYKNKPIPELMVNCNRCNRKMYLMDKSSSYCNIPRVCPICDNFYCNNCMNHIHLECHGIGYTYGNPHGNYYLQDVCINCLELNIKTCITALLQLPMEKRR